MSLIEQFNSFKPFFDFISDKVVILTDSGDIFYANGKFCQFLGIEQDLMTELSIQDWFPGWENLKIELRIEKNYSRMIHLSLPNSGQQKSLRLCSSIIWDNHWLLLFKDPWEPLQTSKNISELIVDHINSPLIFIDPDYKIQAFNPAANLLSVKINREPINVGESLLEWINDPTTLNSFLPQLKIGFSGKITSFTGNHNNSQKIDYKVHPVRDLTEEILGVLIMATEQNNNNVTEIDKNQSGNTFHSVFNGMHDPALLWRKIKDGEIILEEYNIAADQFSGGKISEYVGQNTDNFFNHNVEILQRFTDCIEKGQNVRFETQYQLRTTGELKWVMASYIKISDDLLLNLLIDITDRKIVELSLQENQRRLSTLLESLPGMAYRCKNDQDWTREFVSAGVQDLLGYPAEDLIENRKIRYATLIHPDDQQHVRDRIQSALKEKQNFELTYRIQTLHGEGKWVWEKGQGVFDENGELVALEGFISDITERVLSEQAANNAMIQAQALKQALDDLSSQLDLSQVMRRILVSLKTVLNYDSATLFLKEQEKLKVVAARGFQYTSRLINKTFPTSDLLLKEIQLLKAPIILEDAQTDPRFARWEGAELVRGWMGVPLIRHDEFIGLLTIDNYNPAAYTQEDASLALSFANSAAIVIENARLFEQTQQMALTDTLTGIYNRRYFYELAQKEFSRSKRYQSPVSIIMIDIDHFKNVNDQYGHLAGDQVLIQFVQRIQEELRTPDILARFGGEEFIILLPETNLGEATQVAERLREVTAQYPFLLVTAQVYITISLGVSCFRFTTISLDHLIDESDKALYEAKQFGRNRVRAWQHK